MSLNLSPELLAAGKTIGLLNAQGEIDSAWFENPYACARRILSNPAQREALLKLLDQVAPARPIAGLPPGEKWHALLGAQPQGNAYLTVRTTGPRTVIGLAGEVHGQAAGGKPAGELRMHVPLIAFSGSNPDLAIGQQDSPLSLDLRAVLDLQRPADPITLAAVRVSLRWAAATPAAPSLVIVLEGLGLDDGGKRDLTLDPLDMGSDAIELVVALVRQQLAGVPVAANAVHRLLGLLGYAGDGIPPLPFGQLTAGPAALQSWLNQILAGGRMPSWLAHLAGLLGTTASAAGSGGSADPWRIRLVALGANGALEARAAHADGRLHLGFGLSLQPGGATPAVRLDASATLVAIPLAGSGAALALPQAQLLVSAPGGAGPLVNQPGTIVVQRLQAGARWNGSAQRLEPVVELLSVDFGGVHRERIDLTHADSALDAAAAGLEGALRAMLGGTGSRLLPLVGLGAPQGAPAGWPHQLDLTQLASAPTRALAAVHRAAALNATHHWGFLLGELAQLLGLPGSVAGAGTAGDPWRVLLASDGPLAVDLVAWNATPGDAVVRLRLGLRAGVVRAPWQLHWLAELLGFDLPAAAEGHVGLLGGQHLAVVLDPIPAPPPLGDIGLSADSLQLRFDWTPASGARAQAQLDGLTISAAGDSVNLGTLALPPSVPWDLATPATLPVPLASLEHAASLLIAGALRSWAGPAGEILGAALGLHGRLPGLPADWQTIFDPTDPLRVVNDPLAALRNWFERLTLAAPSAAGPQLTQLLAWIQALLAPARPARIEDVAANLPRIAGAGVHADPWRVPLGTPGSTRAEALLWLDPDGAPGSWAAGLASALSGSGSMLSLLRAAAPIAALAAPLRDAMQGSRAERLAAGLEALAQVLEAGDGVVPATSARPSAAGWSDGGFGLANASHDQLPSDAGLIVSTLTQVALWEPVGPNRVVLLLHPAFAQAAQWAALLAQASAAGFGSQTAGAHFNLRVADADPLALDLSGVTAASTFYSADLADDGAGNHPRIAAQIDRVAARIAQLRPGAKLFIVAHSTSGIAARLFAAAHPTRVSGLITIGTPHRGTPLTPLRSAVAAEALRFVARVHSAFAAGPVKDALAHLVAALDPWRAGAAPGDLPLAAVYPVGSFAPTDTIETGGVPALALGGRLSGTLLDTLRDALAALASGAAATAVTPTHIGFGVRIAAGIGFNQAAQAGAHLRVDLARFALRGGVSEPPRPAQALECLLSLVDPNGGWLVGPAHSHTAIGAPPIDIRVRRLELGVRLVRAEGGGLSAAAFARAVDCAYRTPTLPQLTLDDALAPSVIGAAFDALYGTPPAPGSWLAELAEALEAIGLFAVNAQGRLGLALDALNAIRIDPLGYLKPRVQAALLRPIGWLGLHASAAGEFAFELPGGLELRAGLAAGGTLALGGEIDFALPGNGEDAALSFDFGLALATMRPRGAAGLRVGAVSLAAEFDPARVTVSAPPWLATPFQLLPAPSASAWQGLLNSTLPRFLLSASVSMALRGATGGAYRVAALDTFIADPGAFFTRSGSLGNGSSLDPGRVAGLLTAIASALGQGGPGLTLPGALRLTAGGTDALELGLQTTSAIGGVLQLGVSARIDALLHVTPGGSIGLDFAPAAGWPGLGVAFGVDGGGAVTLAVTPNGGAAIQLLPSFSGFGALLSGAAQTLLPAVLDALVAALPAPRSQLADDALAVVEALDLHDAAGGFAARAAQWRSLLSAGSLGGVVVGLRGNFVDAAVTLLNRLVSAGLPGSFANVAGKLSWTSPLPPGVDNPLTVALGWDGSGAAFRIGADGWRVAAAPLSISFAGGYEGGEPVLSATLAAELKDAIGVAAAPALRMEWSGGAFDLRLRPFNAASADPLDIRLLPTPGVTTTGNLAQRLAEDWLLPIVAKVLVDATVGTGHDAVRNTKLWSTGPSIGQLLQSAGLTTAGGALMTPLPPLPQLVTGLLTGLASGAQLALGGLSVGFSPGPKLGVQLKGKLPIDIGDYRLSLYFGDRPSLPGPEADRGLILELFATTPSIAFQPRLKIKRVGVGFGAKQDRPLLDAGIVRIGEVAAFGYFDVGFLPSVSASGWGFEADLARFGLPLGQAMSGGGGGNPVAASLLSSDGGSGGGDSQAVSPECDIHVGYLDATGFFFEIGGETGKLWITIQRQFGPIYLEQIGIETVEGAKKVALLIDGGVKISGLAVQVDDLAVLIPLAKLDRASEWGLDLKGLAVAMEAGTVKLSGGMLKNPGPPISYDGALMVDVAGRGFTAVGSYARPSDELGEYVSFFVFVTLPFPLGGPPYFFVTGLGGGLGLNRALLPPDDMNQIGNFPLVAAIDNSAFANDPMAALRSMGVSIPPRRGSFWLAAGIKFSSFVIVNSTAVLYVMLDRGLEIGLLGISRMTLPSEDFAIARVELALKARLSTAEALLSVQAQLTERSYLFHPSCQLTGGFAFFVWFRTGRFVLTLGGYHPAFAKPADFPTVPRLGFRWRVSNAIQIKGESFFALTTTCVMAGGRLEASYKGGPVKAWFTVYMEVLISWDPFYYIFDTGIEIGASVDTGIFGEVGASIGAKLHIEGPPLHGWAEVEIVIVTVRIEFGDSSKEPKYIEDFNVFRDKYLVANAEERAVDVRLRAGLLPPEPPGAEPDPGTLEAPWRIGAEFAFESETRMPANAYAGPDGATHNKSAMRIDLAPMKKLDATSRHSLSITRRDGSAVGADAHFDQIKVGEVIGHFPEATWAWQDPRHVKAGARNIDLLAGITLSGEAKFVGKSALIQITGVVDDLPERALPLPFDLPDEGPLIAIHDFGLIAEELALLPRDWTRIERYRAARVILGDERLTGARVAAGAPGQGVSALALAQLNTRSAPPRVVPLSTGLTLDAPAQAAPAAFAAIDEAAPILEAPRLMSVMRQRVAPAADRPLALRTSVSATRALAGIKRIDAPRLSPLAGSRLHRTAPVNAPAATRAVLGARTLHDPSMGLAGRAHAQAFARAAKQIMGDGVAVAAGSTQLWQIPATADKALAGVRLALSGGGVARVVWLDRAGDVIDDVELAPGNGRLLPLPANAAWLALGCLGRLPAQLAERASGMAAVSAMVAPPGRMPAVGWQDGMQLEQVGPHTLLARGATVHVQGVASRSAHGRQMTMGLVRAGQISAGQDTIETRLPGAVTTVAVLLETRDATRAAEGDLAIAADGAVLATPPVVVLGGARRTLLYDVRAQDARAAFTLAVTSEAGWRVVGVIGLHGGAAEWGERLHGAVPPQLVPEGPLSAEGTISARFDIVTPRTMPERDVPAVPKRHRGKR